MAEQRCRFRVHFSRCEIHAAVLVVGLLLAATAVNAGKEEWSYEGETGPSHWCHSFSMCCGSRQSPVNIDTNNVHLEHIPSLQFHHYDRQPASILVRNNGHSIYVDVNQTGSLPMINDGGLGSNYLFVGFHFHWGSEHTIDGRQDPFELHIVHYNSRYGDLKTALKNPDGIAVLGILFELSKEDNQALGDVVKAVPKVKYATENTSIPTEGFSLIDLMPPSTAGFYRYYGSLTTPECQEIVTWTVFETRNFLSEKQLKVFKNLKASHRDDEDVSLSFNFRPVQPLKGRKVRRRLVVSSASIPSMSFVVLLATFVLTCSRTHYKWF